MKNRQMLSADNVAVNDRVCPRLVDYPPRTRLKILYHMRVEDARHHPELVAKFSTPAVQRIVELVFLIDVVSFDWNCPKHITPRYTVAELEALVAPLKQRLAELESNPKS
jgi:predicted pyridoxine 5'-phosphate oxidase superfamily flavin-nucleotide-binding protein